MHRPYGGICIHHHPQQHRISHIYHNRNSRTRNLEKRLSQRIPRQRQTKNLATHLVRKTAQTLRNLARQRDSRQNSQSLPPTNISTSPLPAPIPPPRPTIHITNPVHPRNKFLRKPPRLLPRRREVRPQFATAATRTKPHQNPHISRPRTSAIICDSESHRRFIERRQKFDTHDILIKQQATKIAFNENLKNLSNASYIHFSCHGVFNFDDPLLSLLALADSIEENNETDAESRYVTMRSGRKGDTLRLRNWVNQFNRND
ncbi:MAG: CHAT domain-containing protein [Oscillatoriales cyanobacterium]|nr:MAG: CHAT domain-containing protein [Oscillatoriales cyanobacterium]